MKKFALLLVLICAAAAYYFMLHLNSEPDFSLEEGYSYLYDGESLQGWRVIGGQSTFEADGERIIGRNGPGENTFLRTEKSYGDFSLRMQMRWEQPGNSGVLFRAGQRDGNGRAYGYQFELDHSDRAWSGGIYDEARRGWLADLEGNAEARAAIRLEGWNDVEIEARGPRLRTWINGVPAADIIDGLDASGFIALQVHSGEMGEMHWRRLRIKELPPLAAEGESLIDTAEWRLEHIDALSFAGDTLAGSVAPGPFWLTSRRQFSDALLQFTVPACEAAATIRVRYQPGENSAGAAFAELVIYEDRAEGRLVTALGEESMETVLLEKADHHRVTAVTMGASVVLSVDEVDVLRLDDTELSERGRLRIQPARCGDSFRLEAVAWYSLKEHSAEPLFYQTLDTPPAPVLSPQEAQAAFEVAPGFEVELVAAEPLVEDPVAMAWDEWGRLYVVEMRGYMRDAYGTGSEEPVGQVVRLEDLDGDGRMDTSEVFLGALVNPRAVAVVNEGILIGEPPNLWLCTLPERDALCENKRSVGGYATNTGAANVEHMENGLYPGLDNWLYNAKSARQLRLVDGALQERQGLFRGQWGIAKDDYGRWFYNHNSTWLQADLFAAEDLVGAGAGQSGEGLGVNLTDPAEVFTVRVNPGVNRAYLEGTLREDGRLNRATGVSGLTIYRGDQFPAQYRGDAFVPEVAGNAVAQFAIEAEGLSLTASQRLYDDERWGRREFLASTDERFRPVDAMNGPDGALYIIDMYRGIVQDDHFLTDELREQIFKRQLDTPPGMGRIWRVRHVEGSSTRGLPALASADSATLVAALGADNGWVRDTAQRLLLEGNTASREALAELATGEDTRSALHAIWTLQGRGELQRELVLQIARGDDLHRQVQALRAGRALLQSGDLLALLQDNDDGPTQLLMQLAFALGDHAAGTEVRAALAGLLNRQIDDPYLGQAIIRASRGQALLFLSEFLEAGFPAQDSTAARAVLRDIAGSAYRTLRGDLGSADPADPRLLQLLALTESQRDDASWRQLAMLKGYEEIVDAEGFTPARLASPPPIFSDGTVSEKDPLWDARLAGRAAFTWPGDELAMGLKPLSPEQLQHLELGRGFYTNCAACHGEQGEGIAGLAPALAGASWVTGPPEWLGRIILQGMTGPVEVNGEVFDGVMPPHGHLAELDDQTLAGLMTYLRRSWGNKQGPVSPELVAAVRADSASRGQPWSAVELQAVPYDRGYSAFVGKYKVSFVTLTITEKAQGLHLSVPMYGGGILEQESERVFFGSAGGKEARLEFVLGEGDVAEKLILQYEGEKITVKRKQG